MRVRPAVPGAVLAAAAVVVVGVAALLAAHQPAPPARTPGTLPDGVGASGGGITPPAGSGGLPWWVLPALIVLVGFALALLWFVFRDLLLAPGDERRVVDPHLSEGEDPRAEADLARAARRSLTTAADDLDRGADAREVVVACWVRLEDAARAAGRGRRPSETATDVARRWLGTGDAATAHRAAVDELAALYHLARYSTHPLTADHRARARAALRGALGDGSGDGSGDAAAARIHPATSPGAPT